MDIRINGKTQFIQNFLPNAMFQTKDINARPLSDKTKFWLMLVVFTIVVTIPTKSAYSELIPKNIEQ